MERIYLSKSACKKLGIIDKTFPFIDAFALKEENIDRHVTNKEIKDFKLCTGLESGECNCPKRELPPEIPTECPFPPTVENMGRLEQWIREKYKAS